MLYDELDKLNSLIRNNVYEIPEDYKGEFEEGADWNPEFPAIKTTIEEIVPDAGEIGGQALFFKLDLIVYSAFERNDTEQLKTAKKLLDVLNRANELRKPSITDPTTMEHKGTILYSYAYGVAVYKSTIECKVRAFSSSDFNEDLPAEAPEQPGGEEEE